MKNFFTYDFTDKTINGSMSAIQKANQRIEPQYSQLTAMLQAQPTFTVKVKPVAKKENKKTYRDLSIDRMREYIATQPDSEKNLATFEAVMKVAAARGAKYPLTKKWFLNKFPEFKSSDIENAEEVAKVMAEAKAKKEAEAKALATAEAELDAIEDLESVSDDITVAA